MTEYIIGWDENLVIDTFSKNSLCEQIVRCRDCINYSGEDDEIYPKWCMKMSIREVEPDGFCKWGKRRDA